MKARKPIEGIIFDCDGVLVDSEPISNRVLIDMVKAWGGGQLLFDPLAINGQSLQKCFRYIELIYKNDLPDDFEHEFRSRTYEAFAKEIQPIPGVVHFLESLNLPFCVASNGPREKMEINLKGSGLWPFFEGRLFSAYDIRKWKPDPALFLKAADFLGYEPEQCLVVEDSPTGIQAALNGGFQVVGFLPQVKQGLHFDKSMSTIGNFDELDSWLYL